MNHLSERYGKWCLVAGAAEGIGEAYARAVAEEGLGVILVDQNRLVMEKLALEIEGHYGVPTRTVHLDLAFDEAIPVIKEELEKTSCRLIIYNAAYSRVQPFMKNSTLDLARYLKVNMQKPLQLIHAFCDLHQGRRDEAKGIILMSSLAGSWGTKLLSVYGATKAFNHILAESLYHELKEDGFEVLACIAGATATPGYLASNPGGGRIGIRAMGPEKVARAGLERLGKAPYVVAGMNNRLNYFFLTRIFSRRTALGIMNRAVGKIYREKLIS